MAIADYKIQDGEKARYQLRNGGAPDLLTGTADENKQVFDRLSLFIADKYNQALDSISESITAQNTKSDTIRAELQEEIDDISGNVNPLVPLGMYSTIEELREAHPTGEIGEAWMIGTSSSNTVYIWDINEEDWIDIGGLVNANGFKTAYNKSFEENSSNIQMDGTASAGSLDTVARADHVHPTDTSRASQADMLEVQNVINHLIDYVYPVGAIYMSVNAVNPSTLFGGTWVQIQDRFLLAYGTAYRNGTTGGEATHTLTAAEAAQKNLGTIRQGVMTTTDAISRTNAESGTGATYVLRSPNSAVTRYDITISGSNATSPHNNMPPYLAVNVWKRTA